MIKNRNKIILFLVGICLLVGSFILINNKDIKVKSVSSKGKKYEISYDSGFEKTSWCDRYYSGVGTKVFSASEVSEGYPMYVSNGCATDLDDFVKNNSNLKNDACNATYNYLNNKTWLSEADVSSYNNVCDGDLSVSLNGATCDEVKNLLEKSYIEYAWYYDTFKNECKEEAKSIDVNELKKGSYTSNDSCESRKYNDGFTGILKSGESPKNYGGSSSDVNSCSYVLLYVDGYATTYDDWVDKIKDRENKDDLIDSYKAIKKEYCASEREKAEGKNNSEWYDWLNGECDGVDGYEYLTLENKISIVFDASDGYGIECGNNTSYVSDSVCAIYKNKSDVGNSFTIMSQNLPNTTNLKSLGVQFKFKGWKLKNADDSTCSKEVSFTLTDENITYVPCYEASNNDNTTKFTIYNSCGAKDTSSAKFVTQDSNDNKDDVSNKAVVENSVITTHTYSGMDNNGTYSNVDVKNGDKSFTINQFCSLKCTEEFKFYYPTTFETVKSGTYFNLLSYPEVRSKFTCEENFYIDDLTNKFDAQKNNEIKAYVNLKNSNIIDESISSSVCDDEGNCKYSVSVSLYRNDFSTYNVSASSNNDESAKESLKYKVFGENKTSTYYEKLYNEEVGITNNLIEAAKTCSTVLTENEETYYNVKKSDIDFYYESYNVSKNNVTLKDGVKYEKDTFDKTNVYVNDTGLINDDGKVDVETKSFKFSYLDVSRDNDISNFINKPYFKRTVSRNIIYSKSKDHEAYYSDVLTGTISTVKGKNSMYLGYVYPVRLNLSGNKNVYFKINADTNLGWGASSVLKDGSNFYKCDYDISNDIIIKDTKSEEDDKYKKNFYIRSISTNDVDPNDRIGTGKFGTNWDNDKGKTLIDIIQNRAKKVNTYNPENLEYSFTLNADTIDKIREYNNSQKGNNGYLNDTLSCNNFNGECISEFLENLLNNKIGGSIVKNVSATINRKWKYYINKKWYYTDKNLLKGSTLYQYDNYTSVNKKSILDNCNSVCNSDAKQCYDCIYREINEGVLP